MIILRGEGVWYHWDLTETGALRCDGAGVRGPNTRAKKVYWVAWEPRKRETLLDGEGRPLEFGDLAYAMIEVDRAYPVGGCGTVRTCVKDPDEANRRELDLKALEALRAECADAKRHLELCTGRSFEKTIFDWMSAVEARLVLLEKAEGERR